MDMKENHDLIIQAKNGDDAAFAKLVALYRRMIYKIIFAHHLDNGDFRVDPEDLFQEGCLALYSALFSYEEGRNAKFSTYAYIVIRGRIRQTLRSQCRGVNEGVYSLDCSNDHDEIFRVKEDPESYHREEVFAEELDRFVKSLSSEDQTIFEMKKEDYSYRQIAERLKISVKRVDNRLRCLKKKLKQHLENNDR